MQRARTARTVDYEEVKRMKIHMYICVENFKVNILFN